MSGIVGILHRDGAPAERGLIEALTRFISYVGPDARGAWADGSVALGQTLLATSAESRCEQQPVALDGKFWIVADARIDAREELRAALGGEGRRVRDGASDAEYILEAYAAWGTECVRELLGDFAFAIWDAEKRMFFCARDHFGVKPFFYAEAGAQIIFSNVLDAVRVHPDVPGDLNDAAVGDFLLFGLNCDVSATTFQAIRRLPAGHTLIATRERVVVERYWSAPTDGRIRYKDAREYAEQFAGIFRVAVADRMRGAERIGLLMSGGLDSATVAATARDLARETKPETELRAYTVVYETLFADDEGGYAKQLASALGIPIECIAADALEPFGGWPVEASAASKELGALRGGEVDRLEWPEPVDDPYIAGLFVQFRAIAKTCRVALTGDGSDNLMHFEMWPYAKSLMRGNEWGTLAKQMPGYLKKRKSPVPGAVRRVKKAFGKDEVAPEFPKWISPAMSERLKLKERAGEWRQVPKGPAHPVMPRGHGSLALPQWSNLFEMQNPGVTKCGVEMRHPFLDVRVVKFLLSLPPFPLYMEKKLLREVLAGRVPESVRKRKKTPLAGNPLAQHAGRFDTEWMNGLRWSDEITRYVDTKKCDETMREIAKSSEMKPKTNRIDSAIRPICLNFWLQSMRKVRYNLHAEVRNG